MEMSRIGTEEAVGSLKVLTWHVPGDTEENCDKPYLLIWQS